MELAHIKVLLKKYEDAQTTLEEESILRKYFTLQGKASHLEEYQIMFAYFKSSKNATYEKSIRDITHSRRKYKWFSIAASILFFTSLYPVSEKLSHLNEERKAKKSLAQITEGLKMVSVNLKKGNLAFNTLRLYEESINKIFKN